MGNFYLLGGSFCFGVLPCPAAAGLHDSSSKPLKTLALIRLVVRPCHRSPVSDCSSLPVLRRNLYRPPQISSGSPSPRPLGVDSHSPPRDLANLCPYSRRLRLLIGEEGGQATFFLRGGGAAATATSQGRGGTVRERRKWNLRVRRLTGREPRAGIGAPNRGTCSSKFGS